MCRRVRRSGLGSEEAADARVVDEDGTEGVVCVGLREVDGGVVGASKASARAGGPEGRRPVDGPGEGGHKELLNLVAQRDREEHRRVAPHAPRKQHRGLRVDRPGLSLDSIGWLVGWLVDESVPHARCSMRDEAADRRLLREAKGGRGHTGELVGLAVAQNQRGRSPAAQSTARAGGGRCAVAAGERRAQHSPPRPDG